MRIFTGFVLVVFAVSTAWGYHEFKVPKKAFRKVTIEYFSNDEQKTSPDSTVTIYYDKDNLEMHREIKKGCGNVIGGIDSLSLWEWGETTIADTVLYWDEVAIPNPDWHIAPAEIESLLRVINEQDIPLPDDWDSVADSTIGEFEPMWQGPAKIEPTIFESKPAKIGEYPVITEY